MDKLLFGTQSAFLAMSVVRGPSSVAGIQINQRMRESPSASAVTSLLCRFKSTNNEQRTTDDGHTLFRGFQNGEHHLIH